MVVIRWLL